MEITNQDYVIAAVIWISTAANFVIARRLRLGAFRIRDLFSSWGCPSVEVSEFSNPTQSPPADTASYPEPTQRSPHSNQQPAATPQSVPAAGLVTAGEPPKSDSQRVQDDCVHEVLRAMANTTQKSPAVGATPEVQVVAHSVQTPRSSSPSHQGVPNKTTPGNATQRTPGSRATPLHPRLSPMV